MLRLPFGPRRSKPQDDECSSPASPQSPQLQSPRLAQPEGPARSDEELSRLVAACGIHLELLGQLLHQHRDAAPRRSSTEGPRPAEEPEAKQAAFHRSIAALSQALVCQARPADSLPAACADALDHGKPGVAGGCGDNSDENTSPDPPARISAGSYGAMSVDTVDLEAMEMDISASRSFQNSDNLVAHIVSPAHIASPAFGEEGRISGNSDNGKDGWERDEHVLRELRQATMKRGATKPISFASAKIPEGFSKLRRIISKPQYELFWALLIVMNLIVMILEEEYKGMKKGYNLTGIYVTYGSEGYTNEWWPGAGRAFTVFEYVFAGLFTVEVLITALYDTVTAYNDWPSFRAPFWKEPLDLLDFAVVACSDVALIVGMVDTGVKLQLFRMLRLARLFRLIRLLRKINQFDPLHLMTTAIKGSMGALLFSCMLLFVILTFFAMVLTNVLRYEYLGDDSALELSTQQQLFRYFGTYSRSMLSMFELTLGNWPTITRFMVDELHEAFGPVLVLFKLSVGFAVISVINGVFIRETFAVAESDEFIMVRGRMRQVLQHKDRMARLFRLADKNEDGVLDREEFKSVFKKRAIRNWLEAMDLKCNNADTLFTLIADSPDGTINEEELITGIAKLKGPAKNIDLLTLHLAHGLDVDKQKTSTSVDKQKTTSTTSVDKQRSSTSNSQ